MSDKTKRKLILVGILICLWPMELVLVVYMAVKAVVWHVEGSFTFAETWEFIIECLAEACETFGQWIQTGEFSNS